MPSLKWGFAVIAASVLVALAAPAAAQQRPRQAAPGEVIYLTPPVRGQRPPATVQAPPPNQQGFRIPFLDRLFGRPAPAAAPAAQQAGEAVRGSSGVPASAPVERVAPPRPKVEPKYFVVVIGDSLAEATASGLEEALADRPDIAILRKIAPDRGIIDTDPRLAQTLREFVAARKQVDAVVVATGLSDQKSITEPQVQHPFRSTRWNQLYATRVDEILIALTERRLPIVWLGLPPVADEARSAGNAHINEILRQRLIGFGASFHDVWAGFVDDNEAFAAVGPSLDGRNVRLRLADGVGFTRSGARKYAHYAEVEVRRLFPLQKPGEEAAAVVANSDPSLHILTSAPRTAGATLLSADLPAIRRLKEQEVGAAPLGRVDDFRWKDVN